MSITAPPGQIKIILPGAVLLVGLTACATRGWSDWATVQSLTAKNITEVQVHKDAAPQGSRKIKGHVDSVTDDSITLQLKDGQKRTLDKQDIHRVLTRKPFSKTEMLKTMAATSLGGGAGYVLGGYMFGNGDFRPFLYSLPIALGVSGLVQLKMVRIYEAAPNSKNPRENRQAGNSND